MLFCIQKTDTETVLPIAIAVDAATIGTDAEATAINRRPNISIITSNVELDIRRMNPSIKSELKNPTKIVIIGLISFHGCIHRFPRISCSPIRRKFSESLC